MAKTARGAISFGSTRVAANVLNAASILVLARLLTPNDFGIVAIASAVLSVVLSLTELSVQSVLVQHESPSRAHVDTVWTVSLIRAALVVAALSAASWPISLLYSEARLVPVVIVSGVTGAFMGFYNPMITLVTRDLRFGPTNLFQLIGKSASVGLAILLAVLLHSFWAIIIGNAVGAILAAVTSYFLVPYRPRICLSRLRDIWSFSGWLSVKQLVETINWRFDQLALGLMVPKAQLGIYSVSDNISVLPTREVLEPLRYVIFASFADIRDDLSRLRNAYLRAQSTIAIASMPAGIGLALVAEPAVRVVLGDRWLGCVFFVQIFAVSYSLQGLTPCAQALAMALGKTKAIFIRQVYVMMQRIPLIILGLTLGGATGAANAIFVSAILCYLINLHLVRELLRLSYWEQIRPHGPMFFGLLCMSGMVFWLQRTSQEVISLPALAELCVLASVGGATYVASIVLLWLARGRPDGAISDLIRIANHVLFLRKQAG